MEQNSNKSTRSVYNCYGWDFTPWSISTAGEGDEGFMDFILANVRRKVKPGEPLPNYFFVHHEVPEKKYHKTVREDWKQHLIQSLEGKGIGFPAHIVYLHEAVYCLQNDLPLLPTDGAMQFPCEQYFEASQAIRQSAPDLTAKLDLLEKPLAVRAIRARHVASLPKSPKIGQRV